MVRIRSGFSSRNTAIALFTCALLIGLQACGGGQATQPTVPTFTTIDPPGAASRTTATDINADGDIVGYFYDSNTVPHGFIRSAAGAFTIVDAPGASTHMGFGTQATGINASGTTVGSFVDQGNHGHGFIRAADGTFIVIDVSGASATTANVINDAGIVVGGYSNISGSHGYLRTINGTITTFDAPGIGGSGVLLFTGINSLGATVATFMDNSQGQHGLLRAADGTLSVLDAPGGTPMAGGGTLAHHINDSGVIVGAVESGSGAGQALHGFFRDMDGTYTLFDPPSAVCANPLALGVNANGLIVGICLDANLAVHGYLRNLDGSFTAIDDPNAAQLPNSLTNIGTVPNRINESGTIVGEYSDAAGVMHGFLRK